MCVTLCMSVARLSFECLILSAVSLLMTAYSLQPAHSYTQRTSSSFMKGRESYSCASWAQGVYGHTWHNYVKQLRNIDSSFPSWQWLWEGRGGTKLQILTGQSHNEQLFFSGVARGQYCPTQHTFMSEADQWKIRMWILGKTKRWYRCESNSEKEFQVLEVMSWWHQGEKQGKRIGAEITANIR